MTPSYYTCGIKVILKMNNDLLCNFMVLLNIDGEVYTEMAVKADTTSSSKTQGIVLIIHRQGPCFSKISWLLFTAHGLNVPPNAVIHSLAIRRAV